MKAVLILSLLLFAGFIANSQTRVVLKLPDNCNKATTNNEIDLKNEFHFTLFPNPAGQNVTIKISSREVIGRASIEIFSVDSRRMYSEEIFCNYNELIKQLDLENFSNNSYFIKVTSSHFVSTQPLIVHKN